MDDCKKRKKPNNTAMWKCLCPYFLRDNLKFIVCDICRESDNINGIRIMFNSEEDKISFQNEFCFDRNKTKNFDNITHKWEQCPYARLANMLFDEADK